MREGGERERENELENKLPHCESIVNSESHNQNFLFLEKMTKREHNENARFAVSVIVKIAKVKRKK